VIDKQNAAGMNIRVIGHSYGGDTAATVVSRGHHVDVLVTVDPVGLSRPSLDVVAANSGLWINIDSAGGGFSQANIIAYLGGAWDNAPSRYSNRHYRVKLDHADVWMSYSHANVMEGR